MHFKRMQVPCSVRPNPYFEVRPNHRTLRAKVRPNRTGTEPVPTLKNIFCICLIFVEIITKFLFYLQAKLSCKNWAIFEKMYLKNVGQFCKLYNFKSLFTGSFRVRLIFGPDMFGRPGFGRTSRKSSAEPGIRTYTSTMLLENQWVCSSVETSDVF